MAQILSGKTVSQRIKDELKEEVATLKKQGINPGLAVIIVGDDPASRVYVNNKKKACEEIGVYSEEYALPAEYFSVKIEKISEEDTDLRKITTELIGK